MQKTCLVSLSLLQATPWLSVQVMSPATPLGLMKIKAIISRECRSSYVFTRSGSTWSQQAYLKASNTDVEDFFGQSVAIAGNTVVVGASVSLAMPLGLMAIKVIIQLVFRGGLCVHPQRQQLEPASLFESLQYRCERLFWFLSRYCRHTRGGWRK